MTQRSSDNWDTNLYEQSFGIISRFGSGVVDLLDPRAGERIIDLGCGTGHLTHTISQAGARCIGLDASPSMIEQARSLYPGIAFEVADGTSFTVAEPTDAVFSNAALHWMSPPDQVVASVRQALKPGGRFVAEMGGHGNVETLVSAIYQALGEIGIPRADINNPWYFPSIPEYAALLERSGFEVTFMQLFDRPTPLDDCANGIGDWVRMFGSEFIQAVEPANLPRVYERVDQLTRSRLFHDGQWIADYRRLRFTATRQP